MSYVKFGLENFKFNRWQLTILLGTPLALGVGFFLYNKCVGPSKSEDDGTTNNAKRGKKTTQKSLSKQSLSIDGNSVEEVEGGGGANQANKQEESNHLSPLKEATMYKNEGNACYRRGKFDEAITYYDKAIEICPKENKTDLAIFYQNRAASYEMLRKWNMVKHDCSKSLEYNPKYAKAYFRRAKAYEATNDLHQCLDDITATCILEMFQNDQTIMYADKILKETGRNDSMNGMQEKVPILPSNNFINTYLRSFVADPLQMNADDQNKEEEEEKCSSNDNEKLVGYARAKKALQEQDYSAIIGACTEEIESSESESQCKTEALLLRGTFHLLSTAYTEARQDLDAVIQNEDADLKLRVHALIKRASLNMQLDDRTAGMNDFQEAERLDPKNADLCHQRAQFYILMDKLPEALKEYSKAVDLAPTNAMAYVQKCYAEYRMVLLSGDRMQLVSVMNDFQEAINKFPDCMECYSLMAQVLSDQQQYSQADMFFEKAINISPDNASLLVHRAILALQWKGNIDMAIELITKAIKVDEKCELAYETLGTIEVQRGHLARAVELFEKAISFAKSRDEMCHLCALRNAAVAQINVSQKLGIDMTKITSKMGAATTTSSSSS